MIIKILMRFWIDEHRQIGEQRTMIRASGERGLRLEDRLVAFQGIWSPEAILVDLQ